MKNAHALTVQQVIDAFETDAERGLSSAEAKSRLDRYGLNELPKEKKRSALLLFLGQFNSWLTYILFAAAGAALYVGEKADTAGILIAVLVRAVFGFVQERRAENAVEKLRQMVSYETTVLRDGEPCRIATSGVVPGDVLVVSEGDRLPADARVISAKDLHVDESALTGESSPTRKSADSVSDDAGLGDRSSMLMMGTSAVTGMGRAVVTGTGLDTAFGGIAASLGRIPADRSPLELRMDSLGRLLGIAAIVLAALVFVAGVYGGSPVHGMFFFAVAMMVSVVPEGLPVVLAVVMAIGVRRMAKRNAIVRHVPSVETLGAADIICTDKTGTLTENKMTVREIFVGGQSVSVSGEGWDPEGTFTSEGRLVRPAERIDMNSLIRVAAFCNRATLVRKDGRHVAVGDPTEGALVTLGAKAGFDKEQLLSEYRIVDEIPFSSARMYRAMLVESTVSEVVSRHVFVVGAYEVLKARSVNAAHDGGKRPLPEIEGDFDAAHERMGSEVMRVLAVASRPAAHDTVTLNPDDVRDLELLGLVGMADPPRKGVTDAVAAARRAGIRVIMVTGDQRSTAEAVARQVGIIDGIEGAPAGVYSESDVSAMDGPAFDVAIRDAAIFARVSPETKLRIVNRLQELGHVVAMTGDGVNDAPALKRASIGVAMGIGGTDVSREVADMVLADDNFVTIMAAVEEGRVIFRNVKQTVAYLFMTNVGEVTTVLASMALGLPLPLLPAQILWMNLVTDGFPDMALSTERHKGGVLDVPPRGKGAPILTRGMLLMTAVTAAMMCAGTLAVFVWSLRTDGDLARARSIAFTTMCVFQLWNVFNMRSVRQSIFSIGFFTNRYVTAAVAASLALQFAVLYVPALSSTFRTVPLGLAEWGLIVAVSSSILVAVEGYKVLLRRRVIPWDWA